MCVKTLYPTFYLFIHFVRLFGYQTHVIISYHQLYEDWHNTVFQSLSKFFNN